MKDVMMLYKKYWSYGTGSSDGAEVAMETMERKKAKEKRFLVVYETF